VKKNLVSCVATSTLSFYFSISEHATKTWLSGAVTYNSVCSTLAYFGMTWSC